MFGWLKRLFRFGKQTVVRAEVPEETTLIPAPAEPVSASAPRIETPDNAAVAEALFGDSYKGVIEIGPKGNRAVTGPLKAGGISHNVLAGDNLGPVSEGTYRIGFNKSGGYLEIDSGLPWHKTITERDILAIRRVLQEGGFLEGVDLNRTFLTIYSGPNPGIYNLTGNLVRSLGRQ